jgi:protein-L-isoaspartate O-methyltransferase
LVDLAERLLEIARQKAVSRSLGNVEFHFGDMERLGYPDRRFDLAICGFAIFFVPDTVQQQLRELGGRSARTANWRSRFWGRECWSLASAFFGRR